MRTLIVALFLVAPSVASAEVTNVSPAGFTVKTSIVVPGTPEAAYAAVVSVKEWWEKSHTYSGDSKNMSIAAVPGGCFCEALPGGGVQHGTVVMAMPGNTLRIIGSLGPLQQMAVTGSMTWAFAKAPEGTRIDFTYVVGGNPTLPFDKLAPLVDQGMMAQVMGLKAYAEKRR